MKPKTVAAGFRRSISFSNPYPSRPSKLNHTTKPLHVRSVSLPCRPHPLIPRLKDELSSLRAWASTPGPRTAFWLCEGLGRLRKAHDSLNDVLELPDAQESLRRRPGLVEKLLEDLLRFVDSYGTFRTAFLSLKQDHSAAQVALRKRDDVGMTSYAKGRGKFFKEMGQLASAVLSVRQVPMVTGSDCDGELVGVIGEVIELTVSVSLALFRGISRTTSSPGIAWAGWKLGKKGGVVLEEEGIVEFRKVGLDGVLGGLGKNGEAEIREAGKRMRDLEGHIGKIEGGSERVFRSLINTRVALLNILTQ